MAGKQLLPLPIWLVIPRRVSSPPPNEPCDELRHALAFSSVERLIDFLRSRQAGSWKLEHVYQREGLLLLVADLHRLDVRVICLNPEPDGCGGAAFDLRTMLGQAIDPAA